MYSGVCIRFKRVCVYSRLRQRVVCNGFMPLYLLSHQYKKFCIIYVKSGDLNAPAVNFFEKERKLYAKAGD